jgi:hypothetical protein
MAGRVVQLSPRALRDLQGLPAEAGGEILDDLELLKKIPWAGPPKVKKLRGHDLYRLRTEPRQRKAPFSVPSHAPRHPGTPARHPSSLLAQG